MHFSRSISTGVSPVPGWISLPRWMQCWLQALLQRQAQDIKAYAEACERGDEPKH